MFGGVFFFLVISIQLAPLVVIKKNKKKAAKKKEQPKHNFTSWGEFIDDAPTLTMEMRAEGEKTAPWK